MCIFDWNFLFDIYIYVFQFVKSNYSKKKNGCTIVAEKEPFSKFLPCKGPIAKKRPNATCVKINGFSSCYFVIQKGTIKPYSILSGVPGVFLRAISTTHFLGVG